MNILTHITYSLYHVFLVPLDAGERPSQKEEDEEN
jgi:hypothetical protein